VPQPNKRVEIDIHANQHGRTMRHEESEASKKTRINRSRFKRRPPAYSRVPVSGSDELIGNIFGLNWCLLEATEIKSRIGSNCKFLKGVFFTLTQLSG
jgi:hypothetical protein